MGRIATMRAVRRIGDAVSRTRPPRTSPYDASATVTAVDGGTAWVLLDGAGEPMPVTMTIDSKPGDRVRVRVSSSGAHVTGNATAPPTDDAEALAAKVRASLAKEAADTAQETADTAQETADAAQNVAQATNQHFWHRSTDPDQDGAGTGAFVTDEEQEDFLDAVASGTAPTTARPLHNLLMNAEGILIRAATRIRAAFTPSGVAFYDGQGNQSENILASFGADGAQMGVADAAHIEIDESSVKMYGEEGTEILSIAAGGGFDWGNATASISNNDKIAIENGNSSFSIQKTSGMGLLSVYASAKVQYDDSAVVGEIIARAYEEYNTLVASGFDNVSLYDSGNVVFAGDVEDGTGNVLSGKQDTLTADSNITISNVEVGGLLKLLNANIDRDGSAPSATMWSDSDIRFTDVNAEELAYLRVFETTSGTMAARLQVNNEPAGGGTAVSNHIQLSVSKNGTVGYSVGDAAAFRAALGFDTWTSVATADWFTAESGWTVTTVISYNAALGVVKLRAQFTATTAKTAGNKTLGTVKAAYRPSIRSTVPSLTAASQALYIDAGGSILANTSAVAANGNLWYAGEYHLG